jgi:hypothetical protein
VAVELETATALSTQEMPQPLLGHSKKGEEMKRMFLFGALVLAGCSWQAAAIAVPTAAYALGGGRLANDYVGKLVTDSVYTHRRMAELRQSCYNSGDPDTEDCDIYKAEFSNCLTHLGLFATDDSRRNCEGS